MPAISAKVTLLSHTPLPEHLIASAARLCYSSSDIDGLRQGMTEERAAAFVDMLAEIGHESPIEHAVFTFGIEGVSRALLAQITRHRIASYSVQSQRYVRENQFDYVIPPEIAAIPEARAVFMDAMEQAQQQYTRIASLLASHYIEIDPGMDARVAEKKAIEDARFVLPNACDTKMICTFNARSLINFFSHRCCSRAQWEIRAVATEMLRLVVDAAPGLFRHAGPPCLRGKCPEGKMSCGKMAEIREQFREITGG